MRTAMIVLGFVGASLVGAVGGRILFPADSPDPLAPGRLEARVDDLQAQVARLAEEVRRGRGTPRLPPPVPPPEDSAVLPPAEPPDRGEAEGGVDREEIDAKVREVVEARAEAARKELERRAAAMQAEKDDALLTRLQEALDLTEFQRDELARHLKSRREAVAEYQRKVTEGGADLTSAEREAIRRELRDFVERQDEELRKLLGVDKFDELMRLTSRDRER